MTARFRGHVLYLDTNVFVYAVEGIEPYARALGPLLEAIERGEQEAVTSEVTLAEALVVPLRENDTRRIEAFTLALQTQGGLRVMPVSREILVWAARLRAAHRTLRLPDALHAATAEATGCTALLTNDARFAAVPGLEIVRLADVAGYA